MSPLFLILAPLGASILSLILGNRALFQRIFACSIFALTLSMLFLAQQSGFDSDAAQISMPWIESLGIYFAIGFTQLNFWFLVLTSLVVFAAMMLHLSRSNDEIRSDVLALIYLLQFFLFGVFMAQDLMLFYFFFEASILPIYFISSRYGSPAAVRATLKFFLYTLFGSLFMLLAILFMYSQSGSGNFLFTSFTVGQFSTSVQHYLFLAFFIAFAIKMPLFPFHSWQADAYSESPVESTILMSGILLKMGIYGLMVIVIPMFPMGVKDLGYIFIALSAFGVVYGAFIAMIQHDIRKVLAFSSLSHVGLIGTGLLAYSDIAMEGVVLQMFAHGINIAGLFFVSELISKRAGTRDLDQMGGISQSSFGLTVLFFLFLLGSIAVPLSNGFPGEFQLLMGIFAYNPTLGVLCGLTVIFSSVYMLRLFQKSMLGNPSGNYSVELNPLNGIQILSLCFLASLVLVFGLFPNIISSVTKTALQTLLIAY
jgi:NADH-quinone oxidoreductase subunit M